jgi:DivIVA domain-containing protein
MSERDYYLEKRVEYLEKRVAELERRLGAAPGAPAPVASPAPTAPRVSLTPEQVAGITFSRARITSGYDEGEVDGFLVHVEAALRDPMSSSLTAEQVRGMAFSKPRRWTKGYDELEVDAFLARVVESLDPRQGRH